MNSIKAITYKSKFANEPHLVLAIDGKPLDEFLVEKLGDDNFIGLVPSISWLQLDDEREFSINKLIKNVDSSKVVPLLVCPDDQDFSCTVIVAETEIQDTNIIWNRLGGDQTPNQNPIQIELEVDWFSNIGPMKFDLKQYIECW